MASPGCEAGLAEQRRLLVAEGAGHRHPGAGRRAPCRRPRTTAGSPAAWPRGMSERVQQLRVPVQGGQVHQHGPAGVGDVGDVLRRSASRSARCPWCRRAPRRPRPGPAGRRTLSSSQRDLRAGEVRGQRQPAPLGEPVCAAVAGQLGQQRRRCGCPARRWRVHRLAGVPVPQQRGLALVGDADRRPRRPGRCRPRRSASGTHRLHVVPDLGGVVLDPAGAREVLPVFALVDRHDRPARVEDDAARRGGALVDGDDIALGHARTLPPPRRCGERTAVENYGRGGRTGGGGGRSIDRVRDIAVFSGSAHPELAAEICAHLDVPLSPSRRRGSPMTALRSSCRPTAGNAMCS